MKKSFAKFLVFILYGSLLMLPYFDYLVDDENLTVGRGPNVVLRGLVLVVLVYILIPHNGKYIRLNNPIARMVGFLMIYISVITMVFIQNISIFYTLVTILYPLLGFIGFYYLTKYFYIEEKQFAFFYTLLITIIAITAYLNLSTRMNTYVGLTKADNTGYALVCTYAGIVLLAKKKIFPVTLFLIIVGTLICGKRGAIIAMVISTIPLFLYTFQNNDIKRNNKALFIVLIAIGLFVALRYFSNYFMAAFERFEALEEDEGSGRGIVYLNYWNHFIDADLINQLFGHGLFAGARWSGSKYAFTHVAAHNDWLDLLYSYGVIGFLIYGSIFIRMFMLIIRKRKDKNVYYYMLVMSFIILLIKSIISSTFLMDVNSIYLYITAAYAIAKLEQNNTQNNNNQVLDYDPPTVSS